MVMVGVVKKTVRGGGRNRLGSSDRGGRGEDGTDTVMHSVRYFLLAARILAGCIGAQVARRVPADVPPRPAILRMHSAV